MKKDVLMIKIMAMSLAVAVGSQNTRSLSYASQFVENKDNSQLEGLEYINNDLDKAVYYITDDNRVIPFTGELDPSSLKDGYYQVDRGLGWIRDESDLITSGILEGEGTDNMISLSRSAFTKVTHGLDVEIGTEVEIQDKAALGANVAFGWNPAQTSVNVTASAGKVAGEDATLYLKLYVMSHRLDTYEVRDGVIVDYISSYGPKGTVGIYGEEDQANHINIMDYYIHKPVRAIDGEIDNIKDLGTPLFLASDVLEPAGPGAINSNFLRLDSGEVHQRENIGDTVELKDGIYTRFLGDGWLVGGKGHIGSLTVMPNTFGVFGETLEDSFKVTHSVGISGAVDGDIAGNAATAAVQAAYNHAAERTGATSVEVEVEADTVLKHVEAYENNYKYDVITVEDGKIVEQSHVYQTNGFYANVAEGGKGIQLADGEEKQIFNSLTEQDYLPSISNNHRIYVPGKIGPDFFKLFHADKVAFGAHESVNIQFEVEETGIYKFRAARAYGDYFTKPFQQPQFYVRPEYVRVYNVNPFSGNPNHEEYFKLAGGTPPQYGGAYQEVYLKAGETYTVTVGPSTRTENYKPPNHPGYTMVPSDMFGVVLELEKSSGAYLNAGQQFKLRDVLEVYNTYKEEDYLKESFMDFERVRDYANDLRARAEKAFPEAILEVIENLHRTAAKLIHIEDYAPPTPEIEVEPDLEIGQNEHYVKIDLGTETVEKIPQQDPNTLPDGIYMIDRGYGWIKNEQENLIAVGVVDAGTEEGHIGVTKSTSVATTHSYEESTFIGMQIAKLFQIGVTTGFGQEVTDTQTLTATHTLVVPEGQKGYMKAYIVNHKYETFEVKDGKVISHGSSYSPKGTIGLVALTEDGFIDENAYSVADDTFIFDMEDSKDVLTIEDTEDITELSFEDIPVQQYKEVKSQKGIEVGATYHLNKSIDELEDGQMPNATYVAADEAKKDGVYLQYLGDGYIDGEKSLLNTITADANVQATLEVSTETKSYIEQGAQQTINVEIGLLEMMVSMAYMFSQETGDTIGVVATGFDTEKHAQVKIYDMYKGYVIYEVQGGQVKRDEHFYINSGIYGKTFEPGDYTTALSEETKRNVLTTPVQTFTAEAKRDYKGGADSITSVRESADGTLTPLHRMGYSLDMDLSELPNGTYLVDLGDNWIELETKNLFASSSNYNETSPSSSSMWAMLSETIEHNQAFSVGGTGGLAHQYETEKSKKNLETSIELIVGSGQSIKKGAVVASEMPIDPNHNGDLKMYVGNRRTDLVQIRDGQVVERLTTYTPNGIRTVGYVVDASEQLSKNPYYIGEPTKDTLTAEGMQKVLQFTEDAVSIPYLKRTGHLFITDSEARTNPVLAEQMYDPNTGRLENGIYTFYLGDWHAGEHLGTHYITGGLVGELAKEVTEETSYAFQGDVSGTSFKDKMSKSISSGFSTTIDEGYTILSGTGAEVMTGDSTLELESKQQKFLTVSINNNRIETQGITERLIGTTGYLRDVKIAQPPIVPPPVVEPPKEDGLDMVPPMGTQKAEIHGLSDLIVEVKGKYSLLDGVTATGKRNEDITKSIRVVGDVDTDVEGVYTLTYSATDTDGEVITQTRLVYVEEGEEQEEVGEIVIHGLTDIVVKQYGSYSMINGVWATGKNGDDLSKRISVWGEFGTTRLGVYILNYTVTDVDGEVYTATREVHVVE